MGNPIYTDPWYRLGEYPAHVIFFEKKGPVKTNPEKHRLIRAKHFDIAINHLRGYSWLGYGRSPKIGLEKTLYRWAQINTLYGYKK